MTSGGMRSTSWMLRQAGSSRVTRVTPSAVAAPAPDPPRHRLVRRGEQGVRPPVPLRRAGGRAHPAGHPGRTPTRGRFRDPPASTPPPASAPRSPTAACRGATTPTAPSRSPHPRRTPARSTSTEARGSSCWNARLSPTTPSSAPGKATATATSSSTPPPATSTRSPPWPAGSRSPRSSTCSPPGAQPPARGRHGRAPIGERHPRRRRLPLRRPGRPRPDQRREGDRHPPAGCGVLRLRPVVRHDPRRQDRCRDPRRHPGLRPR
jgi:hypothetical protein